MRSANVSKAVAVGLTILLGSSVRADILVYPESVEGAFNVFNGAEVTASTGPSFDQLGAADGVQGVKGYGSAEFLFTANSDYAPVQFQFRGNG